MRIVKLSDEKAEEATGKMFEGKVYRQPLIDGQIAKEIRVTMIAFNPGARNVFHTHTGEQVLYVTEGKGIVACATYSELVSNSFYPNSNSASFLEYLWV